MEAAVRAQLANLPRAVERSGEAAACVKLAKLLDDENYSALAAQNSYRLGQLLNSLGAPKKKGRSGRLAIESMTQRKPRKAAQ